MMRNVPITAIRSGDGIRAVLDGRGQPLPDGLIVWVDTFACNVCPATIEPEGSAHIRALGNAGQSSYRHYRLKTEDFPSVVVARWHGEGVLVGPAAIWWYSDRHGGELVAVLRRGKDFGLGLSRKYVGHVEAGGDIVLMPCQHGDAAWASVAYNRS